MSLSLYQYILFSLFTLWTYLLNPSYYPTQSPHPLNSTSQLTLSTHPINTCYQSILASHPFNSSFHSSLQHTLSPHPVTPPYHPTLPTHPLNPFSQPTFLTHLINSSSHLLRNDGVHGWNIVLKTLVDKEKTCPLKHSNETNKNITFTADGKVGLMF